MLYAKEEKPMKVAFYLFSEDYLSIRQRYPPISNALFSGVWPRSQRIVFTMPRVWNKPWPIVPLPTNGRSGTPPSGGRRKIRPL
jgi:hypothetical protein